MKMVRLMKKIILFFIPLLIVITIYSYNFADEKSEAVQINKTASSKQSCIEVEQIDNPIIKKLGQDEKNWGLEAINTPNVTPNRAIKVAILDTGINIHSKNIEKGFNVIKKSNEVTDNQGHGTNISAILLKVDPHTHIMPVKVSEDGEIENVEYITQGVQWAIKNRADVINISLSLPKESKKLNKAINKAVKHNIQVVTSAGNKGTYPLVYPASLPNVISVVARDVNNVDVGFSNRSSCKKSFSAPGTGIQINNQTLIGTSYAAPYVSAAIAVIKADEPEIKNDELMKRLKDTAEDGNYFSYGIIQIDKALKNKNE
jgi:subtilisin family serine protease